MTENSPLYIIARDPARAIRADAIKDATRDRRTVARSLWSKGINFGAITARSDGSVVTSGGRGVDPDLRVRPLFLHGETISIREFTDFKRHDLGPNFHEVNYDGTLRKEFLTMALWGVANTGPYGHDGRSMNLKDVILRHGGEAQPQRDQFARLSSTDQRYVIEFLDTLVLFPPDDTASNLDPGDRTVPGYPQVAHGRINLGALFNNPADRE